MRALLAHMICLFSFPAVLSAQPRTLRYHPEGSDFTITNGTRRFNRALYGTNTAFRVETGDLPEFALYMPGMGGNLNFELSYNHTTKKLIDAAIIKASYRPGSMLYTIRDPLLGDAILYITVEALADAEGMIIRFTAPKANPGTHLKAFFGGVSGKKFSRDGDIGADPESSWYLDTAAARGDHYTIDGNTFTLDKKLEGTFPAKLTVDTYSILHGEIPIKDTSYLLIRKPSLTPIADLPVLFNAAETKRAALAARVQLHTPDPYLNTIGGALAVAADAIWEAPTYMHGAVAWRQRLPAWRGPYVADLLGWHDRAREHFSSYALSQLTTPDQGPVVADTNLHLARQLEKLGTSLFSSGYICRNPNGDFRPHHYDMNLVFIDQLLTHFYWTGDTNYVRQMWPVLKRHLDWEKRNFDSDGDGLYDAYCCIWASDALEYGGGGVTHSSAYNYRANFIAADLARLIGEDPSPYEIEAAHILQAMTSKLWVTEKGSYAEYIDWPDGSVVKPNVHPAAGLWTIYQAIDSRTTDPFQAWQSLHYIDTDIPHISIRAAGLEDTTLYILSTTNWQPYTWSLNNVVLAESLQTALAYWQGGRPGEAFRLWKGSLVESMYLGASPGNFEQISAYDVARGELYRDFADPIGVAARSLVEGLFGIEPDALHDTLTITPGWPTQWPYASLKIPDITIDYDHDHYRITPNFSHPMALRFKLKVRSEPNITVNGKPAHYNYLAKAIGAPMIEIIAPPSPTYDIQITYNNTPITGTITDSYNPGSDVTFEHYKYDTITWWMPVIHPTSSHPSPLVATKTGRPEMISLTAWFNASVTEIFKNQYLSPRPKTPTLQLPTQGIGNWCYPLATANIDDAGIRAADGTLTLPNHIPLATPQTGHNIIFTSRWDNYPDSISIPLKGKAAHAWFMLAGSTNPMQSRITNGLIVIHYTDNTSDTLKLTNPSTWWPIEEDYYEAPPAFSTSAPHPLRVYLKTGIISDKPQKWTSIKGLTNTAIDGGAATILDMPLNPEKKLDHLVLKTVARDVVVGLMSITLNTVKP